MWFGLVNGVYCPVDTSYWHSVCIQRIRPGAKPQNETREGRLISDKITFRRPVSATGIRWDGRQSRKFLLYFMALNEGPELVTNFEWKDKIRSLRTMAETAFKRPWGSLVNILCALSAQLSLKLPTSFPGWPSWARCPSPAYTSGSKL